MSEKDIHTVKSKNEKKLMKKRGVVGVGVSKEGEEDVIIVMTDQLSSKSAKRIPEQLDGYKVIIKNTGTIRAL